MAGRAKNLPKYAGSDTLPLRGGFHSFPCGEACSFGPRASARRSGRATGLPCSPAGRLSLLAPWVRGLQRLLAPARGALKLLDRDPEARPGTGPLAVRMKPRWRHPVPAPRAGDPAASEQSPLHPRGGFEYPLPRLGGPATHAARGLPRVTNGAICESVGAAILGGMC